MSRRPFPESRLLPRVIDWGRVAAGGLVMLALLSVLLIGLLGIAAWV